ncbi:MAG TPA: aspartyl protease family protein [Terriglobales bacterium]|nr:aspartyl protease family protein [Terriglobales bacterium]
MSDRPRGNVYVARCNVIAEIQMKFARTCIAVAAIIGLGSFAGQATPQPTQSEIGSADRFFQMGKFAEAGKLYSQIVIQNPKDYSATLQLGRIALLSNRLDDAQKWLEKAIALKPGDADAKVMLAEAFYRRDDFQKAAASLNGVEVSSNKLLISQYPALNVAKLESFKGQTPYELQGNGTSTRVKFVRTEPLPVVSVRVNGGDEVTFFIDTGGSEVALDTEFAKELGVPQFGAVQGTFSGGQHAEVQQGRIESLTVGDWTIKNLPTGMLPLRQLSQGLGVKQINGIIGTTLFYHFLTTMDYPRGELVLRRKDAKSLEEFKKSPGKRVAVPIWMASDHFMVGWGRVETLPPALLFVDTGLTGAGVKLAESVIKDAGIRLEESKASEGAGGGGKLKIVPYTVHHLSFGDIKEENVPGLYDGPFPWENMFGFHLAGMVGHDFFKPYAVTFDFQNMQIFLQ